MNKMSEEIVKVICAIPFEKWQHISTGYNNMVDGYKIELNKIDIVLLKDSGSMPPHIRIDDLIISNDSITDLYLTLEKFEAQRKAMKQQEQLKDIYNKIVLTVDAN